MGNKNNFFWKITLSIFFILGITTMIFIETINIGLILLMLSFFGSMIYFSQNYKIRFSDNFLLMTMCISLIVLIHTLFIFYSKNIVIISTSFFALNFLIQISSLKKMPKKNKIVLSELKNKNIKKISKKPLKTVEKETVVKKTEEIKEAIQELKEAITKKEDIKKKETYYHTSKGKSFHLAGCISISRTKQEDLKKNNSRQDLISKGYKNCKNCNS